MIENGHTFTEIEEMVKKDVYRGCLVYDTYVCNMGKKIDERSKEELSGKDRKKLKGNG